MVTVHLVTGLAVLALNLFAGVWGGAAWLARRPSVGFWYALRAAQAVVVLQVLLGGLLVSLNHVAADLHYLYGALPLIVALLAEGARAGAAQQEIGEIDFDALPEDRQRQVALAIYRREIGIMAVSCLVVFLLALRAVGTTTLV